MATKGKTKKPTARREAADETTSSERLTALVEESDALARIVAKNPSAPVSLLRVLSRSEDEATRKNVILNPFTPYDVLSELENQFTELFVNNQTISLDGFYTRQDYPELLRRIRFKDPESGKTLVFITNNFSLPAATIKSGTRILQFNEALISWNIPSVSFTSDFR